VKRIWLLGLVLVLVMGPSSVSWARPVSRYVVTMQSVTGGAVVGFTDTTVTSVEVFVGCEWWSASNATGGVGIHRCPVHDGGDTDGANLQISQL
jgi:hypothetical protein